MRYLKRKMFTSLIFLLLVLTLAGCGEDGEREVGSPPGETGTEISVKAEVSVEETVSKGSAAGILTLPELWYNGSIYAKRWAPVVIVGSVLLGWIIFDIFKKNREVQKWAVDLLIIKIPAFTFIAIYVYAFLYRMLNL